MILHSALCFTMEVHTLPVQHVFIVLVQSHSALDWNSYFCPLLKLYDRYLHKRKSLCLANIISAYFVYYRIGSQDI